jgi:putative endonuclease
MRTNLVAKDDRLLDAIAAERRIKGWSRAKKEAYMRGDCSALVALAKRGSKGA